MRKLILVAALLLTACHWGTRPRKFFPAQMPDGAHVAIRVAGETTDRVGELFAADTAGVHVHSDRFIFVRWRDLRGLDVDKLADEYSVRSGVTPSREKLTLLAAISRFPQGLTDELRARVLGSVGQREVDVLPASSSDSLDRAEKSARIDSIADVIQLTIDRYRDRAAAIADGYRRIGGDFPGMGEHWVNPGRIHDSRAIDATRPSFLTYVEIDRQPRLLGAGLIVSSDPGGSVSLPSPRFWHEHSGMISEESGIRSDDAVDTTRTRIWVLHVWTALDNPSGRFAADNWALPFARAGRDAPAGVDADAGQAFALTVGGDKFLETLLDEAGLVDSTNMVAVALTIANARETIERTAAPTAAQLRRRWAELHHELRRIIGDRVDRAMRSSHGH